MPGGVLHVPEGHAGIEGQGHEGAAPAVRAEPVGAVQPGGPGKVADHAEGGRLVESASAVGEQGHESQVPAALGGAGCRSRTSGDQDDPELVSIESVVWLSSATLGRRTLARGERSIRPSSRA
jgi:hypothetical protein